MSPAKKKQKLKPPHATQPDDEVFLNLNFLLEPLAECRLICPHKATCASDGGLSARSCEAGGFLLSASKTLV
jgi:hypothetical protein